MAEKLYGYAGKVLRVNLTTSKISTEPTDKALLKQYLGGTAYAARILWDHLPAKLDPLSPDNLLIVCTGPLTGTLIPCSGSVEFCFKSPLTGIFGETRAGGAFGPRVKFAGYDFIIVEGRSEKPVYLNIFDDDVELRDASHIWGKTVHEATDIILDEIHNHNASVACIGPGGEKLVRYASIMVDYDRAAGRCGGGAVMGSKNLKAIAVDGDRDVVAADPDKFWEAAMEGMKRVGKRRDTFGILGTIGGLAGLNEAGALPTKNFQTCYFEDAPKISGDELARKYLAKRRACFACPIGCGRYAGIPGGKYLTPLHEGSEYETAVMLGAEAMVSDLEAVVRASYLCNTYGLDTISTGNVIAFAIEAFERGLITEKDTEGLKLRWGDPEVVLNLIDMIVQRKGIGDLLAEGVKRVAEKLNRDAADFACHGKGLEMPAHDSRGTGKSMAVQYAIGNPRGACHVHPSWTAMWDFSRNDMGLKEFGLPDPPSDRFQETGVNRGKAFKIIVSFGELASVLVICTQAIHGTAEENLNPSRLSTLLSALTGWNITPEELLTIGERSYNLKRCFNVREGISRKDDTLPKRQVEPLASGPTKGIKVENLEGMLDEVYEGLGWDKETGIPSREKLSELGLQDVADVVWRNRS